MIGDSPSQPIDFLVVGGGPSGTAAAWRAHELGLSTMVMDRDGVLSIIKEWADHLPKPKNVDADYGSQVDLMFPKGGALIAQLPYDDQSPADQLYSRWMKVYEENKVPFKSGAEFIGCTRSPDGVLAAEFMELQSQARGKIHCRAMLLALGGGSPAKVRLMGDGLGIRYKLGNSADFVGGPACVVGGGMSAAEAVVAIALAKAKAKDPSDVFWCYRGREMPKVAQGKALAARFYEAWTQGNIRYLPLSEPLAVFKDEKGRELVAVKTRRVELSGQPPELVCYEFEKKQVLAFIGTERPTQLLAEVGIQEFALADAPTKKRLAVTSLRESQVKNVFLGGGLLAPAYIETSDFRPEALQSTLKEFDSSIKAGMIDGVAIAETVHARLKKGATDAAIRAQQIKQAPAPAAATPTPAPAALAPATAPAEPELSARFQRISYAENPQAPAQSDLALPVGDSIVGRAGGRVVVPTDATLLDQHAAFRVDGDECYVTNVPYGGSVYVTINSERTLPPGTVLVVGQRRVRIEVLNGRIAVALLDSGGNVARTIPLGPEERSIGREDLDPTDRSISRKSHFTACDAGGQARVRNDLSRNGTQIELRGQVRLNEKDEVWMGSQCFRCIDLPDVAADAPSQILGPGAMAAAAATLVAAPAPASAKAAPRAPAAAAAVAAPAPQPAAAPAGGPPSVAFADGATIPADPELPILSALAGNGRASSDSDSIDGECQTQWECWSDDNPGSSGGSCGKCCVVVLDGMASLSPLGTPEKNTMMKKSKRYFGGRFDEARCRLACQARASGPVRIQPLGKVE
jgi:thioredoxin reductase